MDHGDHADYGKLYAIHTGCLAMIHDQFAIGCGVMWSRRAASCAFSIGGPYLFLL